MRWWVLCSLLLPLSASAASVLLVPQDDKARALAEELNEPLSAQKLVVKMAGAGSPAVACLADKATRDACLTAIEEKAKVSGVFIVSGSLKGARGSLTIELLGHGKVIKKVTTAVTKGRVKQQMKGALAQLIKLFPKDEPPAPPPEPIKVTVTPREPEPVKEPEKQPEPVKTADAPKVEPRSNLTPTAKPADDLALTSKTPVAPRPKVAAWVVTGLAVAAAGTAATFGGLGLAGKGRLEAAPDGVSALSYSQATALQQETNTQLSVALGAGIGAGVTGVVAGILWGVE